MMGAQLGHLILPGSGENGGGAFAWLEKIENGILVHYTVPVKTRRRLPAHMLGPSQTPFGETAPDRILEQWSVSKKTVFCQELTAVNAAMAKALLAKEEIDKAEAEGKFAGLQIDTV